MDGIRVVTKRRMCSLVNKRNRVNKLLFARSSEGRGVHPHWGACKCESSKVRKQGAAESHCGHPPGGEPEENNRVRALYAHTPLLTRRRNTKERHRRIR